MRVIGRIAASLWIAAAIGCSDMEDPTAVPIESIITVQRVESSTLRADGISTTTLRATVPAEATTKDVVFRTDLGRFRGASGDGTELTVKANQQGHAEAILAMGTTSGTAHISAGVSNFLARADIVVLPAFPDSLLIETSSSTVTRDGKTKPLITVYLNRTTGTVSTGIPVTFTATQTRNGGTVSAGRFTGLDGAKSNAQQKATVTFTADTGDITAGTVVIRATTTNDQGAPVSAELTLTVLDS